MRALKISFAGLAGTAVLQLVVVVASGSVALLADTVHNFADALTAIPLGFAFWIGRRPPTRRFTHGYGRAEDLAGVVIVAVMTLSSAMAVRQSVHRLLHPQPVCNLVLVGVAGVAGLLGNEAVAAYRIRVGRRIGSAALVADGHHARTDGLTSLAVVVGAIGTAAGWRSADAVVGLAIGAVILCVLWHAGRDIIRRLMDSVDPTVVDQIESVLAGVEGVEAVDAVRARWVGHELRVEAEIVADPNVTVSRAHEISQEAQHRLFHQVRRLGKVVIHTSPCGHDGVDRQSLRQGSPT